MECREENTDRDLRASGSPLVFPPQRMKRRDPTATVEIEGGDMLAKGRGFSPLKQRGISQRETDLWPLAGGDARTDLLMSRGDRVAQRGECVPDSFHSHACFRVVNTTTVDPWGRRDERPSQRRQRGLCG